MSNPYMEVEPTWKSPISRLAITGVEFFLPKEVRFSPSFHVVLLKVQEKKNKTKQSLERDLVLCSICTIHL